MKSSWMLVAGLLFGCMGVFVKLGAAHFSYIELVFYRSFFGLLLVYGIMRQQRVSVATRYWRNHLWRGISGSVALALFFYCITVLPLATAVTLNYTAPLFLTLLTMLVFKDKFHLPLTIAIGMGFCGVVLLLQPTLQQDQLLPGLLGLISGFLAGVAYLNVKQLAMIGEPDARTVFYFSLTATLGSGIWILFGTMAGIIDPRHQLYLNWRMTFGNVDDSKQVFRPMFWSWTVYSLLPILIHWICNIMRWTGYNVLAEILDAERYFSPLWVLFSLMSIFTISVLLMDGFNVLKKGWKMVAHR